MSGPGDTDLAAAIAASGVGIVVEDDRTHTATANPVAAAVLGLDDPCVPTAAFRDAFARLEARAAVAPQADPGAPDATPGLRRWLWHRPDPPVHLLVTRATLPAGLVWTFLEIPGGAPPTAAEPVTAGPAPAMHLLLAPVLDSTGDPVDLEIREISDALVRSFGRRLAAAGRLDPGTPPTRADILRVTLRAVATSVDPHLGPSPLGVGLFGLLLDAAAGAKALTLDDLPVVDHRTDGVRRLQVRAVPGADGLRVTFHDSTAAYTLRQEVAVLEQRLTRLLDRGPVMTFRLRRGGVITWISGAVERLTGRPPDEVVGRNAAEFCHPDDYLAVFDAVQRARAGEDPQDFTARFVHLDGTVRHLEGRLFLASGEAPTADRDIDAIAIDVTPHREAERLRAFLTAGAGHELRTPLAFLVTSLHLLRDGLVDAATSDGRDLVDRMIGTTERLARLSNRLLTLQRLELTTTLPDRAPTAVGSVVVDAARSAPTPRGVTVAVHDETAGAVLTVDADNLAQAVVNLVDNAVAHSPDGQTVTVSARVAGSRLVVTVRDRGPGIPAEARPTAFDPFRRSPAGTRPGGAGLGLAIVRSIARLHSGSVVVEDPPTGPGAQFVLVLQGAETSGTDGADGSAEPLGQAAGPPDGAR